MASATSGSHRVGVVDVRVDRQRDAAVTRGAGNPLDPGPDVVLEPVLGQTHQRLGGEPDVTDVLDLQQPRQEVLEPRPRHVRDVAAGDHHVAHLGRAAQVVEHVAEPVAGLAGELELLDHRGGVADQVHPGAVAAVLRAGRQQLREHLGRVAVGQPLGHPHVVLVERVAGGVRVRRPVGTTVRQHRQHVAADRVGEERLGQRTGTPRCDVGCHRVHHLRRHQHRHGGPLGLVASQVGVEGLVDEVAEQVAQLAEVLHAVGALPLGGGPLLGGDVLPAREPGPVGLHQLDPAVGVGLATEVAGVGGPVGCGVDAVVDVDAHAVLPRWRACGGRAYGRARRLCRTRPWCQSRRGTSVSPAQRRKSAG